MPLYKIFPRVLDCPLSRSSLTALYMMRSVPCDGTGKKSGSGFPAGSHRRRGRCEIIEIVIILYHIGTVSDSYRNRAMCASNRSVKHSQG